MSAANVHYQHYVDPVVAISDVPTQDEWRMFLSEFKAHDFIVSPLTIFGTQAQWHSDATVSESVDALFRDFSFSCAFPHA
jgi:hypothetical protein